MDSKRDKIRAAAEKDRKKLADINKEIEDSLQYIGNTASTAYDRVSIKVPCLDWITKRLSASHDTVIALLDELDSAESENIKQKVCISYLSEGVAKLWDSVSDGMHDARSLVGDTTLNMQENLMQIGIDARGKKALKGSE